MSAVLDRVEVLRDRFGVVTNNQAVKRLSDETRELAARCLAGEFGTPMENAAFALDPADAEGLSPDLQYAKVIQLIAEQTPIRILPQELLVGDAQLLEATNHSTPASEIKSISHTTIGFDAALKTGYRGIRQRIEARLKQDVDDKQKDFLNAMLMCLGAATTWHDRYIVALKDLLEQTRGAQHEHYKEVLPHAVNVPEGPPSNFREAVQSLWFLWEFQRVCGNWSGLGRLDKMLGPYLEEDLRKGAITLGEARELIAHFWIKGTEWVGAPNYHLGGSGDAQFYQNVVLGGVDEDGEPILNDVTWLILDVVEELHISDFPVAVRVSSQTPDKLFRRIAEVQRLGGGIVSIYNDDVLVTALHNYGYEISDARSYANDGCWEPLIPGKSSFGYQPFDTLLLLQETLGLSAEESVARQNKVECDEWGGHKPDDAKTPEYADFEALYAAFRARLADTVEELTSSKPLNDHPCPLLSLLVEGCIEKARSYTACGPTFIIRSPHAGGIPDVANSLLVIQRLVYEQKELSLAEFVDILRSDWRDHESLRKRIRAEYHFYGNDSAEVDALMQRVFDDFTDLVWAAGKRHGVMRPPGISTFGREIGFRHHRLAAAHGTRKGEILATNLAPTPGTDMSGPTAVMKSFCSVDYKKLPGCCPLDLKIHPACTKGEIGIRAMTTLLKTFVQLGGPYLQLDVVDTETLRDAQKHPERYPNLSVRISGWSARFATLNETWQEMVIARTVQEFGNR